jgi:integrase
MSEDNSTRRSKPAKPSPDFPLTPHTTGRWCKKIAGKVRYFGRWEDPEGALREYQAFLDGKPVEKLPRPEQTGKPAKPYPEYPLTAHPSGVWCKKIRGKLHYFGPWEDPDGALAKYLDQKDALHAGRTPRPDPEGLTVKDLANAFLNAQQEKVANGEQAARTWLDYKETCDVLVKELSKGRLVSDLAPEDWVALRRKMARRWGPYRLNNTMQRIRTVFRFANRNGLAKIDLDSLFGDRLQRVSKKTIRLHRAKQGAKLFTADEIRRLFDAAGTPMKAILLLGINCGFGNADCGNLPRTAVNLEQGMIDFPRPKTGIPRRCVLWPDTVEAIREALARRPEPKNEAHAGLVFVTQRGLSWSKDTADSPVTKATRKLLDSLGMNGHRNFYCLRHTFRTVADESKDQPAVDFIMGHEVPHMSAVYRETISDVRLKAVADHVRAWLFPQSAQTTGYERGVE